MKNFIVIKAEKTTPYKHEPKKFILVAECETYQEAIAKHKELKTQGMTNIFVGTSYEFNNFIK